MTPPSQVSCFKDNLFEREAGKQADSYCLLFLAPWAETWHPLPSIQCLCVMTQVRYHKGQNSKHNSQILLLFCLRYHLQSAFCGLLVISGPSASAVHNLEAILDVGHEFKRRTKRVVNSTNTFGSGAACTAAVEAQVQNSAS